MKQWINNWSIILFIASSVADYAMNKIIDQFFIFHRPYCFSDRISSGFDAPHTTPASRSAASKSSKHPRSTASAGVVRPDLVNRVIVHELVDVRDLQGRGAVSGRQAGCKMVWVPKRKRSKDKNNLWVLRGFFLLR